MGWFARLGALPLSLTSPRRALAQLADATAVLDRPGRFLFVFPSGRQIPAHMPLEFKGGVLRIEQSTEAALVPLAIRYEFGESPKPRIWISVGPPLPRSSAKDLKRLTVIERAVQAELSCIDLQLDAWSRDPNSPIQANFTSLLHAEPKPARAGRVPWLSRSLPKGALRTSHQPLPGERELLP
jgi:1-acyl-sn-glycerol-3-phosphate acyltransferase